jgi:hypothetical protein
MPSHQQRAISTQKLTACIRQSIKSDQNPLLGKPNDLFALAEMTKSEPA